MSHKRSIGYKGRDSRPTMKTHAGVKERHQNIGLIEFGRACDEFLKSRGQRVGLERLEYAAR